MSDDRPERRGIGTALSQWFRNKSDLKHQRPFALVLPGFQHARVLSDLGDETQLPARVLVELLSDPQPRLLGREALIHHPELTDALENVWRRIPRLVLLVPVPDAASTALAILGRQVQPDAKVLPNLVHSLEARALEAQERSDEEVAEAERWETNHVPTIVIDVRGRPLLLNAEARELLGRRDVTHLEQVIGPEACHELASSLDELQETGSLNLAGELDTPRLGVWKLKLKVTWCGSCIAVIVDEREQVAPPRPRDATRVGLRSLGPPSRPHPKTGRFKKPSGTILAWLHCEPLAPIPIGDKFEVTVGRNDDNDLVLPHKSVSRHHASLRVHGADIHIEDLGSSNGLVINGDKRTRQTLKVGDTVVIGPYELILRGANEGSRLGPSDTTIHTDIGLLVRGAALAGRLSDTPLAELLPSLEFNQKTGILTVISEAQPKASLALLEGQTWSARFGELEDVDAVLAMLRLCEGHFTFANEAPEPPRTMRATLTSLLLEASRQLDEEAAQQASEACSSEEEPAEAVDEATSAD